MPESRVQVFFYGSFMSVAVLKQGGLRPQRVDPARLWGFDIHIGPLANVVRSDRGCVYGILCDASHAELAELYGQDWVGSYQPEAVSIVTLDGSQRPALCYIAPSMRHAPPADEYVDRMVHAAREHGFPGWYLDRLESFRVTR